jgi:hypothetical protein
MNEALERIAADVVALHALQVDQRGEFRAIPSTPWRADFLGLLRRHGGRRPGRARSRWWSNASRDWLNGDGAVHAAGVAVLEQHAPRSVREAVAAGQHSHAGILEAGSRSRPGRRWGARSAAPTAHR